MADVGETNSTEAAARRRQREASATTRDDAEHDVQEALDRTTAANESGTYADRVSAGEHLQDTVDDARDVGVGWGRIGTILGIARGNAYHRYRKRPE